MNPKAWQSSHRLDYNRFAMATVTLPTDILPRVPKGEFVNEPFIDFKAPDNARKMKEALGSSPIN